LQDSQEDGVSEPETDAGSAPESADESDLRPHSWSLAGTHYADRNGVWSWYAHRVTGFLIFVVVLVHVADRVLVLSSPDSYNAVVAIYTHPAGVLLDFVVFGAVLYHALNGLRIIIIDLWPAMTMYHRKLWWASWIIFVIVGVPGALIILLPVWRGWFGI
jgi:succinate dehydrogenase / fumarate reductase cytochrome b subunit